MISKELKAETVSWRLNIRCGIEDPFETSYDVGHVLRDSTFKLIKEECARGFALCMGAHVDYVGLDPGLIFGGFV